MTADNRLLGGRVPKMDENTLEVLSEESIGVYLEYMDKLKSLFTAYYHMNFNAGKKVIKWRELEEKNHTVASRCFLKLCRQKFLLPHMFHVETL